MLLRTIDSQPAANTVIQAVLAYTLPVVPDPYQGGEFLAYSLVDPDNRRPVDYGARQSALTGHECLKQEVIAALLILRKNDPDLWRQGSYEPLSFHSDSDTLFGFRRRNEQSILLVIVCRTMPYSQAGNIELDVEHSDVLTGVLYGPGNTSVAEIMGGRAAAVLYALIT